MPQGENGYVKDYRSTIDWEWFTDVNTAHLWEYIRLRVNYEPSRFRGMEIRRGEMLESLPVIAANTGLSVKSVRTALEHLKRTGEIETKPTRYGTLIFAVKYAFFQDQTSTAGTPNGTPPSREVAGKWQGSGREVATYKENKNIRNKENKNKRIKEPEDDHVLTAEELKKLNEEIENSEWETLKQ